MQVAFSPPNPTHARGSISYPTRGVFPKWPPSGILFCDKAWAGGMSAPTNGSCSRNLKPARRPPIMRVIVEAITGPCGTRRFVVATGQSMKIGRAEAADISFPRDGYMSSIHFQIEATRDACIVTDLGSANKTFVNQAQITAPTVLRGGEKISAGQTVFAVKIEADLKASMDFMPAALFSAAPSQSVAQPMGSLSLSGSPAEIPLPPPLFPERSSSDPPSAEWLPAIQPSPRNYHTPSPPIAPLSRRHDTPPLPQPPAFYPGEIVLPSQLEAQAAPPPLQGVFTAESCESGLTLCRGEMAALPAVEVAVRLSRLYPLCLLVDFQHLGSPRPADLVSPQYIFNWINPVAAAIVSPLVIPQEDLLTWPAIVEEGWGKDAVICLFSKLGRPELLEHIRSCCRAKGRDSVVGFCWSCVLAPVLSCNKDMAGRFMQGIEAVLVELPDLPETWQVYGRPQIVKDLEDLGLVRDKQQPAKAPG